MVIIIIITIIIIPHLMSQAALPFSPVIQPVEVRDVAGLLGAVTHALGPDAGELHLHSHTRVSLPT
jgi:hypothetical protein